MTGRMRQRFENPRKNRIRKDIGREGVVLTIPARRNFFLLGFLAFWLAGWTVGGLFAIGSLIGEWDKEGPQWFLLFWLGGWAFGWLMAARILVTNLIGQERLLITNQGIIQELRIAFYSRSHAYQARSIKRLAWQADGGQQTTIPLFSDKRLGAVQFHYGTETIILARGTDSAEGAFVIETMQSIANLAKDMPA